MLPKCDIERFKLLDSLKITSKCDIERFKLLFSSTVSLSGSLRSVSESSKDLSTFEDSESVYEESVKSDNSFSGCLNSYRSDHN